jgi:hypothetical protein
MTTRTVENLKKELHRIETEKERVTAKLDLAASRITEMLHGLGHLGNGQSAGKPTTAKKRKRIRRGPEQLKQDAEAIIQFVKDKGADGAMGNEIRKHHPKVGPNIKGFVQKHGGRKLKSTGKKSKMRYFVP